MARPTLIGPISSQTARDWSLAIDGVTVPCVSHLVLTHPAIGTLTYGLTPRGYDSWSFREAASGGSVVVPFAMQHGRLYVGVVLQDRPNQGKQVWNVPRGFAEPAETPETAARRELAEETGYLAGVTDVWALGGQPANPNSAFFDTSGADEGVRFFAVEVAAEKLEVRDGRLTFRPEFISSDGEERGKEGIDELAFLPWIEVARLGDMFSNAATARLLSFLVDARRLTI